MTVPGGKSRNPVFILIARQGDTTTLSPGGAVKPKNLPAHRTGQSLEPFTTTLPADRYLSPIDSNGACTEILRRRLRMTVPGGKSRNPVFILIAEGDTTTL